MKLKRVLGWTALAIPLTLFVAVFIAYWMSDNACGERSAVAPGNPVKAEDSLEPVNAVLQ